MEAPPLVWVIWAGENPMTEQRKKNLADIRAKAGCEVRLVTPSNLDAILEEYDCPNLHPAYEHLSSTHRSDYLRIFLAVHVGGAYVDVKPLQAPIRPLVDLLNEQRDKDFLGQRVAGMYTVARSAHSLCKREWIKDPSQIPCTCLGFFVSKPGSKFATEFLRRMDALLTGRKEQLAAFPGHFARHVIADPNHYPIPWMGLLGEIGHELQLRTFSNQCHFVAQNSVILEGQSCSSYRGIEGDAIAQVWIPVCDSPDSVERARKQIRLFNGREFPDSLVSASALGRWAVVSRVCGIMMSHPFKGKMAFLLREWSSEDLMLRASEMHASMQNVERGFYVSEECSLLIIAQRLIPQLRNFLTGCGYNVVRERLVEALEENIH